MKNLRFLIILAILTLVGSLVYRGSLFSDRHQAQQKSEVTSQRTTEAVKDSNSIATEHLTNESATFDQAQAASNRIEAIRLGADHYNRTIDFWGLVVDQDNHPLSGVKVAFRYMKAIYMGGTDVRDQQLSETSTSDANGAFALIGAKGGVLTVESFEKNGYQTRIYNQGFRYFGSDGFRPDSTRPVVFKMWKIRGAEPLVHQSKTVRIPYDGTTVGFDLIQGRMSSDVDDSQDIRVTLLRTPIEIKRGRQKYDWVATVESVNGGVIESRDEFMYLAPEMDYQPKIEIQMLASEPGWTTDKRIAVYVKSRGGKCYSRVFLDFRTGSDQKGTGFSFDAYVNPAGSRNLEYDPNKRIDPATMK